MKPRAARIASTAWRCSSLRRGAALPAEVQARLFPHLELMDLPLGKILYESGDTMRYVYFPTDSIV